MDQFVDGHSQCLHRNANLASLIFAPMRNRSLHQNRHNGAMNEDQKERERLQKALKAWWDRHHGPERIRSVKKWAEASGLSPSTINPVLNGSSRKRLDDQSYFLMAVGATQILKRDVSADELKGEDEKEKESNDECVFSALLEELKEHEPDLYKIYTDGLTAQVAFSRAKRGQVS